MQINLGGPKEQSDLPIDWQAELSRHNQWLRTVVYARLREADGVDEVMQEVALAAIKQSAPIRDLARVAPWLYRLAVRQSLLYRRKRGRLRKLADRYAARHYCDPSVGCGDPLNWLLAEERAALVRTALERLSRGDAEILLLKYTQDWSYRDIARQLGVSASAVEARLHRARRRLRDELGALEVVESRDEQALSNP